MSNELSVLKQDTVDAVALRIKDFQSRGEIALPPNYSPDNALKIAWLKILETVDKDKRSALEVCTKESIVNSLLKMVIQGLNPDKSQCYFIIKGKTLCCDRSYFGTIAVAKMVDSTIEEINAEVVYEGDVFKYKINSRGRKELVEHIPDFANIDKRKIIAAYAVVVDKNDNVKRTEFRTWDEILQAWKQSKQYAVDEKGNLKIGSVHDKFTSDMAKRTVINYICKPIINSSDDNGLLEKSLRESEIESTDSEVAEEIEQNANKEPIVIGVVANVPDEIKSNYTVSGKVFEVESKTIVNNEPDF